MILTQMDILLCFSVHSAIISIGVTSFKSVKPFDFVSFHPNFMSFAYGFIKTFVHGIS